MKFTDENLDKLFLKLKDANSREELKDITIKTEVRELTTRDIIDDESQLNITYVTFKLEKWKNIYNKS